MRTAHSGSDCFEGCDAEPIISVQMLFPSSKWKDATDDDTYNTQPVRHFHNYVSISVWDIPRIHMHTSYMCRIARINLHRNDIIAACVCVCEGHQVWHDLLQYT